MQAESFYRMILALQADGLECKNEKHIDCQFQGWGWQNNLSYQSGLVPSSGWTQGAATRFG
jgi:hypothetical protein